MIYSHQAEKSDLNPCAAEYISSNNKAKTKWKKVFSFNTNLSLCPVEESKKGHAMHLSRCCFSKHTQQSPFLRKWVAYADDTGAGQSPGLGNWERRKGKELGLFVNSTEQQGDQSWNGHTHPANWLQETEVRDRDKAGEATHLGAWLETREGRVASMGGDARPQADSGHSVTLLSKGAHGNRDNKNSNREDIASLRAFQNKYTWQNFWPGRNHDTFRTRHILRGRNSKGIWWQTSIYNLNFCELWVLCLNQETGYLQVSLTMKLQPGNILKPGNKGKDN